MENTRKSFATRSEKEYTLSNNTDPDNRNIEDANQYAYKTNISNFGSIEF
jgi:hypothetical protein